MEAMERAYIDGFAAAARVVEAAIETHSDLEWAMDDVDGESAILLQRIVLGDRKATPRTTGLLAGYAAAFGVEPNFDNFLND